jgi:hypothetical protein
VPAPKHSLIDLYFKIINPSYIYRDKNYIFAKITVFLLKQTKKISVEWHYFTFLQISGLCSIGDRF